MKDLAKISDRLPANYDQLIDSLEVRVVLRVDDNDYEGDTRLLLTDGQRWGLLTFGWGSCSGCDAFLSCTTLADFVALQHHLWNDIHWEPSAAKLLAYVNAKDWSLDYSWHQEAGRVFIAKVHEWLMEMAS